MTILSMTMAGRAPGARRGLTWLGLWSTLGFAVSVQRYVTERRFAHDPYTWWQSVRAELPDWYLWGLIAVLLVPVVRRLPITGSNWPRAAQRWAGIAVGLTAAFLASAVCVQWVLRLMTGEPYPLPRKLLDNFLIYYHWDLLICLAIIGVVHARAALLDRPPSGPSPSTPAPYRERFLARLADRAVVIAAADVVALEADRNYVRLRARGGAPRVRGTLGGLEGSLDPRRFQRISRSTIVNLERVRTIEPWFHGDAVVVMDDGARLRMSRTFRPAFEAALA